MSKKITLKHVKKKMNDMKKERFLIEFNGG